MLATATGRRRGIDIWPGFVDAMASILMVFIFMLVLFVLAQFILTHTLLGRDQALEQLSQGINDLLQTLSLERKRSHELESEVSRLGRELRLAGAARDALRRDLERMTEQARQSAERANTLQLRLTDSLDTLQADRDTLTQKLKQIASLQEDIAALRTVREQLEREVAGLAAALERSRQEVTAEREQRTRAEDRLAESDALTTRQGQELLSLRDRSKALEAQLADREERTRLAQKTLDEQDLRIQDLTARVTRYDELLAAEHGLSHDARAKVAALNEQITALRGELARLNQALEVSEGTAAQYRIEVADLGRKLNQALADKVRELQRYRSEFFGRLREVMGDVSGVRIEGDRFVFQSELLFASGSDELQAGAKPELTKLADTLKGVIEKIPTDLDWILRVDGHTDRRAIHTEKFPSNWELSTARAVAVVNFLIRQGIPPQHLAAAGFGEFRPVDSGLSPQAYARNRRIELKLTGP